MKAAANKKLSKAEQRKVELGAKLREARAAAKLTQCNIASIFGYTTKMYVSNWERGVVYPPRHIIPRLCEILKIDPGPILDVMKEAWVEREILVGPKKKRQG